MYSHEIENLLKLREYLLTSEEYLQIHDNSPQIKEVKYTPSEDIFETWTNDGYYFKYKVKKKLK